MSDNETTQEAPKQTDQSISEIDKALQSANARRAKKASTGEATAPKAPKAAKEPKAPAEPKRPRLTEEEKAARLATRETERAARKVTRDAARTAKLAERAASRQPAHMRKVEKAAAKLGNLSEASQLIFNEATANLPGAELATLALHIQHHNRVSATSRALSQKIEKDQTVTINGGDPRYIGRTGVVFKAQRIRCYVTLEGVSKPVYLFTSDVSPVAAESSEAASA